MSIQSNRKAGALKELSDGVKSKSMRLNKKTIPNVPGVYFFRDKRGQILYIGKAVNLKNRLANYFKFQLGGRTAKLMEKAAKISWQETDSGIEALILESQLIKKHRPPFNIMLRDDKQYFYVGFTKEQFPKIFITHRPEADSRKPVATLVGPFTDGGALKTVLNLLRRIFPYCTCKQKHNNYCLNYHIGKCLGFCCLKKVNNKRSTVNSRIYKKNIKAISDILAGRRIGLIKKLKKEMAGLGKKYAFEKAIELRGKIQKLEKVFENARIILDSKFQILDSKIGSTNQSVVKKLAETLGFKHLPRRIEGYDISNIQGKFATGAMAVFTDGQPDKNQYRKFKIRTNNQPDDIAMLREVLTRRFNHPEWPYPNLIIVDGGKAQLNIVVKVIYGHRKTIGLAMTQNQIPVVALTKDAKHRGSYILVDKQKSVVPLTKLPPEIRNLILRVDSEAHRFAISYYRKLHRKL